jgi:predicted transcriptional regulator
LQQRKERDMTYRTRTKTEIMSQILRVANGVGARKTNIMYEAFLGFAQMKGYLRVLTENNLLNYDAHTQTFKTTEKGLRFIEAYNQMDGMIKAAEEEEQQV